MAAPEIGRRRRQNPGMGAKVNTSHPLAAGLVLFVMDGFNFVTRRQGTFNDTMTRVASPIGRAWQGSTGGYWSWPLATSWTAWSCAFYGLCPTAGTDVRCGQWDNPPIQSWLMQLSTTPAVYVSASNSYPNVAAGALTANQWAMMSTSRTAGGTQSIYLNGGLAGSGSLAAPDVATLEFQMINSPDSTTSNTAALAAFWSRDLSAAEHALFANDPFALLR